jgi:hypothetical protein
MNHLLLQAADLIEQYVSKLDTSKSTCECCGLTKYENFAEHQAHTELTAIVRKLRSRYKSQRE